MILALQTNTFGAFGGIPMYNRMMCRALNALGDFDDGDKRLLIAMDRPEDLVPANEELPSLKLEAFGANRWRFIRRAALTALQARINLALIGHVNHAPLGLMLKRLRPGLRYGVMAYGVEAWSRLSPLKHRALRAADFVIAISEHTRCQLIEKNEIDAERIYLLPCTLEWEEQGSFEFRVSSHESSKRQIRLLSVCRLEESEKYKGVDTVIEALPLIIDRVPELEYVVIGSGSDLERHRTLAREMGVSDRVNFLGSVDDATLRAAYEACDIFVLPSAGEGFGIVFLEAMHFRKPVIAANSGAAPEVVKDNQTGLLVEYGNAEQLASAIIRLCQNEDLRKQLGAAGYQRLQENFTFDQFKAKLREIVLLELPSECAVSHTRKAGADLPA
jgi:phosphatidylinositol alpha-1,6-mannosyltransferase